MRAPNPIDLAQRHPVICACLAVGALQLLFVALDWPHLLGPYRDLADPDSYMRLLRVERLWNTGRWYDPGSPWTNAPFGDVLHWTRPLDVLLILGAWPLSLAVSSRDAIFWAGVIVGPVLQLASVVVLYWGTRPLLSRPAYVLLAALFGTQLFSRNYFLPARPDHHGLQLFLFAVTVSCVLNLAARPRRGWLARGAGVVAGLALWVSPEALIPIGWVCLALGLLYIVGGRPWPRRIADYLGAVSVTVLVVLPIERARADLFAVEYDRLSIVHLSLFVALAVVWYAVASWVPTGRSWGVRLRVGAATTAAVALLMALVFPRFFLGPYVDVDPRMSAGWLYPVNEFPWLVGPDGIRPAHWVYAFGPLLVALPFAVASWRHRDSSSLWLALLAAMVVIMPQTLYDIRMAPYVELPMVIAWCAAIQAVAVRLGRGRLRVLVLAAMLSAHAFVGAVWLAAAQPGRMTGDECAWGTIAPLLRGLRSVNGDDQVILFALPHQGPEIAYRTGALVVGAPYHRNTRSFLHSLDVLRATEDVRAREILMARDVDYVVLCRHAVEGRRYLPRGVATDVFLGRLLADQYPDWLVPVTLPDELRESFILLAVAP